MGPNPGMTPGSVALQGDLHGAKRPGELKSADLVDLSARWEMRGQSPTFPVRLYTREGLPFAATAVEIPFAVGTVLAGAEPFNVYLDTGAEKAGNHPLVVIGRNRTLTVVR